MEQHIFRLARAGGIDTNPTTFTQRAGTFASAATNTGHATLLTRREKSGLNGYLILPAASLGTNAALHLAHTVGARVEEATMPPSIGGRQMRTIDIRVLVTETYSTAQIRSSLQSTACMRTRHPMSYDDWGGADGQVLE